MSRLFINDNSHRNYGVAGTGTRAWWVRERCPKDLIVLSWAMRQMVSTGGKQWIRKMIGFIWELLRVKSLRNIQKEYSSCHCHQSVSPKDQSERLRARILSKQLRDLGRWSKRWERPGRQCGESLGLRGGWIKRSALGRLSCDSSRIRRKTEKEQSHEAIGEQSEI